MIWKLIDESNAAGSWMLVVEKVISTRKIQKPLSDGGKRTRKGKFGWLLLDILELRFAHLPIRGLFLLIFHVVGSWNDLRYVLIGH